ncbi:MAG: hypothetical protein EOP51_28180 [Sphingobacteriales bacterium]|nr:MAG: hypothetical protein EOP51_28180 [Sphingobacteriales bacterium]
MVAKNGDGCTSGAANAQVNEQPNVAKPTGTATSPGCFQTSGSITITNFDASLTYTLLRNGASTGISQVNGVFNNVPSGTGYTIRATKGSCDNTSNPITVNPAPACTVLCTYTQGFYGNKNGLAMLPSLLTKPITIGRTGRSFTIPANTAMVKSAVKLNSIMPGGSTPAVLKVGNCNMMDACLSQYLTNQGRINNVLLSQTITLTLNTRLKGGILASFPIKSGYIVTQSGGCKQLNSTVVNYLTANGLKTATVNDLLALANDVLGGTKIAGSGGVPSLSNINAVIDAINNIFDGCRDFVGYFPTCPYSTTVSASVRGTEELSGNISALKVSTYPNPFRDKVRFVIESPVAGRASLDLYNMLGQKVHTVFQGHVAAGVSQVVEYNVSLVGQSNLMYTLIMNGERVTGKLLYVKQ